MTSRCWQWTGCREGSAGGIIRMKGAYIPTKNVGTYAPPAADTGHFHGLKGMRSPSEGECVN
jgi:hypothetical protein